MVNYVLLNSRHKLGGYSSFSEYFFDENFSRNNNVGSNLNDIQKGILESKKITIFWPLIIHLMKIWLIIMML